MPEDIGCLPMPALINRMTVLRDGAVAIVMLVLGLLAMAVSYRYLDPADLDYDLPAVSTGVLLVMAVTLPLAVRRLLPTIVVVVVTVAFCVFRVIHVPEETVSSLSLFVAIYTAGAWEDDRSRRLVGRGVAVSSAVGILVWSIFTKIEFVDTDAFLALTLAIGLNAAFFVVAWVMGDLARARRENEAELARRAEQLAAEREERARQAVVEERVRIARELHDVVAHHVSVMGVQAGAARRILAADPERATEALASIEGSGRLAVSELQKLVGFLRSRDEADLPTGPQPTLDDLDALIEQTAAAGLPVERRVIGRPRPIPDSVALSVYRIVQESLTNALKHAGSVPTHVVLTFTRDTLEVEVVNRRGTHPASPGGGRGLVGMRERVAMLGGAFSSGMTGDGGYRVAASLPTGTAYDVVGTHP